MNKDFPEGFDPHKEIDEAPSVGNWHLPPEQVPDIADKEAYEEFIRDLHIRVGLLFDLELARARAEIAGKKPPSGQDIIDILLPDISE
jgi:hypothetical protein